MKQEEIKHGTLYKYQLGCRCDACCKFNREYFKAYRERKKEERRRLAIKPFKASFSEEEIVITTGLKFEQVSLGHWVKIAG